MGASLMTPIERINAAIKLEPYDRVPVAPLIDYYFAVRRKGYTVAQGYADYKGIAFPAMVDLFDEVGGWDAAVIPTWLPSVNPAHPFNGKESPTSIPGKGVPDNAPPQVFETEVITLEDYDTIIKLGWYGYCEKSRQEVRPGPLEKAVAWAERLLVQARKDTQKWYDRQIPVLCGSLVQSPLMILSLGRSLTRFTLDIYRIPDKVKAVMDAMVDNLIENAITTSKLMGVPGVDLVLERGGGFYFPLKIFERFEMPYIKKMVDAFAREGLVTMLHFDQNWTLNLPYFVDLPKKMCICELDGKTNIFEAKRILGKHMCIMGDVPAGLLSLGTPQEVERYCKKLIDEIGNDTGFILSTGCSLPLDAKFENFKTMIDIGKNYRAPWM